MTQIFLRSPTPLDPGQRRPALISPAWAGNMCQAQRVPTSKHRQGQDGRGIAWGQTDRMERGTGGLTDRREYGKEKTDGAVQVGTGGMEHSRQGHVEHGAWPGGESTEGMDRQTDMGHGTGGTDRSGCVGGWADLREGTAERRSRVWGGQMDRELCGMDGWMDRAEDSLQGRLDKVWCVGQAPCLDGWTVQGWTDTWHGALCTSALLMSA